MEQKNKSRSRVKTAVFCVVGVHVAALLAALLAQGCKREQAEAPQPEQPVLPAIEETNVLPVDSNLPPVMAETNLPVAPVAEESSPVLPPPTVQEYTIQKGDTFYTIGKKLNVPWTAIRDANPNVNPSRLQIGQKIVIPSPTTTGPAPGGIAPGLPIPAPSAGGEQTYVVKSGDTLTKIARAHGTTVKALRSANHLTTDRIIVGKKLIIPGKPAAPAPAPMETTPPPPSAPTPGPSGQ